MKSMDRSFPLSGRLRGLGRKIAETLLVAGHRLVATAKIAACLQDCARLPMLSIFVKRMFQKRNVRSHSSFVNLIPSRCTSLQTHSSQFLFIQKLHRLSGVDLADLRVNNKRVLLLAGIVLLALPRLSWADAQTLDLTQKSLEDLMSIEVTSVSKKEQKTSEAAAAVFVISRKDIAHSGALNIPDLLRMVPGLDVAQIDTANWAISARGFNGQFSNKLLVLVDGRTVYTDVFAGVFWDSQNVPLGSIERIEVIRGPGAAIWGSNAVNGVINIITLSAADTQGATIAASAGNGSIGPETLGYSGKARKFGAYRFYAEGFEVNALPTLARLEGQDDWRLVHGGFRTDTTISAKASLTTEGEAYVGNAGELAYIPLSLQPPESATVALRDRYSGWNLQTRWNRTFSPRSEATLQVSFDRTSRGDTTYGLGLNTFDIDFQHHIVWGTRQDIVWGLGYRLSADDISPTLRVSATPQVRHTELFSTFAQDEIAIRPDRIQLSLGARVEHNDYTGFDFQPSGHLMWTPDSRNSIWAAVSHADRTPARSDTDFRVNFEAIPGPGNLPILVSLFGNQNQKNEQVTAFEMGYRTTFTSRFSLDSTVFYNRYRDLVSVEPGAMRIETNPVPEHLLIPSSFGNGLFGEAQGIEIFAKWRVTRLWTIEPGYAFFSLHLHKFVGSQDTISVYGTEGGTPDHQAQLRSSLDLRWKFQWNASAYFVNRLPAQSIPSYTRLDTGLIWRAGENASLSMEGQNLLKDLHPEFTGTDSTVQSGLMRRAVYGKITWSF
jgi:iron complex outermembrane recepter protein